MYEWGIFYTFIGKNAIFMGIFQILLDVNLIIRANRVVNLKNKWEPHIFSISKHHLFSKIPNIFACEMGNWLKDKQY